MRCRYAHLAPQHQLDTVRLQDGWGKQPAMADVQTDAKADTIGLGSTAPELQAHAQVAVQ